MLEENKKVLCLDLLKGEISPALGCTEPAAVALCAAGAAELLGEKVEQVEVYVSEYILKNGMNVGIPGLDCTGLCMAAALGTVIAEPQKKLLILNGLTEEDKHQALEMVKKDRVLVLLKKNVDKIYVAVKVVHGEHTAEAVIEKEHTSFVRKVKDKRIVWEMAGERNDNRYIKNADENTKYERVSLQEIWEFVNTASDSSLAFLQEVIDMNMKAAEDGMKKDYGLHIGRIGIRENRAGLIGADIANKAAFTTAAAVDARMGGGLLPVMSVAGSGNQGLTATIPVIVTANEIGSSSEMLYRALALSILITIHAKQYIGRLSVLCGCSIASAIGVSAAMIFLYGGSLEDMYAGIRTMTADISGMICDGAKPGCALKIVTSVNAAARAAVLAINGTGATGQDGIVQKNAEETLKNLGKLGNEGMSGTNGVILNMLLCKTNAENCG